MELTKPLCRLPVQFDAEILRTEVSSLPSTAWIRDCDIAESTVVPLISTEPAQRDFINGQGRLSAHFDQLPYLKQVLASFGVAWHSSLLLRLPAGVKTPEHVDVDCHWSARVPLLIPIVTNPSVMFRCGGDATHIPSGEAWVFNNWRPYRFENETSEDCVYLLAHTSGDKAFWELLDHSDAECELVIEHHYYQNWGAIGIVTERTLRPLVMHPAELARCISDLSRELVASTIPEHTTSLERFRATLVGFCHDWRHTYAMYGDAPSGWEHFLKLSDDLRTVSRSVAQGLTISTNLLSASDVLDRLLEMILDLPDRPMTQRKSTPLRSPSAPVLSRPIFIIGAPRSGTTLLFETLATNSNVCTVGDDQFWLPENLLRLAPGAPRIDSNRLDAEHATHMTTSWVIKHILANVRNFSGHAVAIDDRMRFLEKTPRNCLRIPFFNQIFADALFVFLWRDPRETISSMIENWHPKGMVAYKRLSGFDRPWCFMLPPGWRTVCNKDVEEIAAYQWTCANRIALNDLLALPRKRWTVIRYSDLIDNPKETITELCKFIELDIDQALTKRLAAPLPLSRSTISRPQPEKWRRHEVAITRILPQVDSTWRHLEDLTLN